MRWLFCVIAGSMLALPPLAEAEDIAISGFNEDVVAENKPGSYAYPFDIRLAYWIENGFGGGVGLPSSRMFLSATGSGVVYDLQPYDNNNVLRMGDIDPASGTMVVRTGQYTALHILAASATDSSGLTPQALGQSSDITLNFADGAVTLPKALQAYDWDIVASQAPSGVVAITGLDREYVGMSRLDSRHHFSMYETTLDFSGLGVSGRVLQSVTFNDISVHQATGVFAIDGTPTTLLPGDADRDGLVGFDDLVTLARNYARGTATWEMGDVNGDGFVGFDDLVILARNYGQSLTSGQLAELPSAVRADVEAAFAQVPEPAQVGLLCIAGLGLSRRRRR